MKQHLRQAAAHFGLFFFLLFLFYLLLVASAAIPNAALRENMERSAFRYGQVDAFQFGNSGKLHTVADNYADSILLNVAWHMGEGNPFTAAIDTDYYDGEEDGINTGLYRSVTAQAAANRDYTRYWHGGAAFVRLFHLFTTAAGMQVTGLASILLLALMTALLLHKQGHGGLGFLLLLSLAAVQIWNTVRSLEYQTPFLVAFLFCPLFLTLERRGDDVLPLLCTAAGVTVAFFDFLTAETVTVLIPLILVVAVRAREGRLPGLRSVLLLLLKCGLCWGLAYGMTFLLKWTAATLVTGENAFLPAIESVTERMGRNVHIPYTEEPGFFTPLAANLTVLFGGTARVQPLRVLLGTALSLAVLASLWFLFRGKQPEKTGSVSVLLLGAVVLLRFLVLNNHSYLHEYFTYRALSAMVLALLSALWLNCPSAKKTASAGKRRRK
ncbi:MAG: hypothetical protein IJP11_08775 [Oscillospiraceae bacterium]|nr:hypothetical protein [Oscillospiraceae bacterium]